MGFEIKITSSTPLEALATMAAAAHYCMYVPAVRDAANDILTSDKSAATPGPNSNTPARIPASTPNSGPVPGQNPPHNAALPTPQQGGYPGNGNAQNQQQPVSRQNPAQNGYGQNQSPNGYGQNQAPNGNGNNQSPNGYGQNPVSNGNGNNSGYQPNTSAGVQGGTPNANPTAGMSGANPATTTQTSLFNNQAPVHPGPGAVPVTSAPTFTLEQVGKAGADLVTENPTKYGELQGLLHQYGVQSCSELKQEQLAPFAQALRKLGAKI